MVHKNYLTKLVLFLLAVPAVLFASQQYDIENVIDSMLDELNHTCSTEYSQESIDALLSQTPKASRELVMQKKTIRKKYCVRLHES